MVKKHSTPLFGLINVFFIVVSVSIYSTALQAQSAATPKDTQAKPSASTQAQYEDLLEKYYNSRYDKESFHSGILVTYRMHAHKTDPKFSYIETPEFSKQAAAKFKEHWKSVARQYLTLQELQFLVIWNNSSTKKKLDSLGEEIFFPANIAKLFDSIPVKPQKKTTENSNQNPPLKH